MHPSISSRIRLLRDLAAYPAAVAQFNRRMFRLRVCIVLFVIAGIASAALAAWLPDTTPAPAKQPATTRATQHR